MINVVLKSNTKLGYNNIIISTFCVLICSLFFACVFSDCRFYSFVPFSYTRDNTQHAQYSLLTIYYTVIQKNIRK